MLLRLVDSGLLNLSFAHDTADEGCACVSGRINKGELLSHSLLHIDEPVWAVNNYFLMERRVGF